MEVRIADREDVPKVLGLYRQLNPDDEEMAADEAMKNLDLLKRYPGSDVFVGCVADDLVATCTLVVIPNLTRGGAPYALIENVVTDAAHRNKGYGKAVLKEAIAAAWRADCYKIMLLTGSTQPAVHQFYRNAGFEQNKTGFQMRRIPSRLS